MVILMEWQPIEIAPKDGTEVLLFGDRFDSAYLCAFHDGEWKYAKRYPDCWDLNRHPTHWMPLPDPPK